MIGATIFLFLRILELVTLIPIWGMLAYFVNEYSENDNTPPASILVLFIVSIIATAWALLTMFQYRRYPFTSLIVAFIDLLLFGALIAGVYYLREVRNFDCSRWDSPVWVIRNGNTVKAGWAEDWGLTVEKHCGMYKAAWALGIVNVILFFFTALLAAHLYRKAERKEIVREKRARRHSTRRSRYW